MKGIKITDPGLKKILKLKDEMVARIKKIHSRDFKKQKPKKKTIKYSVIRGKTDTKDFGKVHKITFENKSSIYVFKRGWQFKLNLTWKLLFDILRYRTVEMKIPYCEIGIALDETYKAGYVNKDK